MALTVHIRRVGRRRFWRIAGDIGWCKAGGEGRGKKGNAGEGEASHVAGLAIETEARARVPTRRGSSSMRVDSFGLPLAPHSSVAILLVGVEASVEFAFCASSPEKVRGPKPAHTLRQHFRRARAVLTVPVLYAVSTVLVRSGERAVPM